MQPWAKRRWGASLRARRLGCNVGLSVFAARRGLRALPRYSGNGWPTLAFRQGAEQGRTFPGQDPGQPMLGKG